SFNIGSGKKTSISEVAAVARELFKIPAVPVYTTMPNRRWDIVEWFANPAKAESRLRWQARTSFQEGFARTTEWYRTIEDKDKYHRASKQFGLDTRNSISAIIACYKDYKAIPIMYERLKTVFNKLNVEHEIIFVNDNSPDDSEEIIRGLT